MLYVTTLNTNDDYTAYRALVGDQAQDGGCFTPFRLPIFNDDALAQFAENSFNKNVSDILNLFFGFNIDGYDLDLNVGKNLIRMVTINRRVVVAELWHNISGQLTYVENALCKKLEDETNTKISRDWAVIAIKIAFTFGLYGQLLRDGVLKTGETIDFSVYDETFQTQIALWYCRKMGLPIKILICTCEESGKLWDFINRGTLQTANLGKTFCRNIERLLYVTIGCDIVKEFSNAVDNSANFSVPAVVLPDLSSGFFCSVAGKNRAPSVINSLYRTSEYITDTNTALCYGGLQDYRAKTGDSNLTVILSEVNPCHCLDIITEATGLDAQKIRDRLN